MSIYAEIDLAAARHNLEYVRQKVPQTKIMAVVKANAYGHGVFNLAKVYSTADALAVARVSEGVALRQAGFDLPIVILEGFVTETDLMACRDFNLQSVVHDGSQLVLLNEADPTQRWSVWFKIDTGMNRLGFKPTHLPNAYQQLIGLPCIEKPVPILTHLACADELDNEFTKEQLVCFEELVGNYDVPYSIANSAGILAWPQAYQDWVRPGLMLYGISPFPGTSGQDYGLQPVMTLRSRIIAIKSIQKGEKVGYGNSWMAERPSRIGIVGIGYGDGYPRQVPSGTPVLVNNQRMTLIGRVSMDMLSVDLTEYPETKIGDSVILWGKGLPVEEIAQYANTIAYTLVCGLTQRVKWVTIEDS